MRKINICCGFILFILALTGCARQLPPLASHPPMETRMPETAAERNARTEKTEVEILIETAEPAIIEADWSHYFDKIHGAAVIYDPAENCYQIYNRELANTRRSPCSTFKIISSLIGLEHGII